MSGNLYDMLRGSLPPVIRLCLVLALFLPPAPQARQVTVLVNKHPENPAQVIQLESGLINEFAAQQGLQITWQNFAGVEELFSRLAAVTGDVIITSIDSDAVELDDPVEYSLPWGIASQQIVVRTGTHRLRGIQDLAWRQVAVKRSSPAWDQLADMAAAQPGMDLLVIPEHAGADEVLGYVSRGRYDMAILDSFSLEEAMPRFLDLEIAFNLDSESALAWAIRSDDKTLRQDLNRFLYRKHLQQDVSQVYTEDLDALQERRILRLITYRSPVNYYLANGKLQGFEYELLERFARNHRMRLAVEIADSHAEMVEMLRHGRGDVIAASVTRGSMRGHGDLAFTRQYGFSSPVVVGRTLDYPLLDARDLNGRRIALPATSPYRSLLKQLRDNGIDLDIVPARHGLNTTATLFEVSQGEVDLTVIGSHQINAEFIGHLNIKTHFNLAEPQPLAWVVRKTDTRLLAALNEYIDAEYRQAFYNVLIAKYITDPVMPQDSELLAQIEQLSPYDEIVHKYAEQYGFDWRLIVAQMYQESRFNPAATSYAGARGLMQLIPETAELLGIEDVNDPDTSIHGGVRYLSYLRGRFEEDLQADERTWFTLAAYNAGYNRVKRARWLAEQMSLDKNVWFDNVEKAMLVLGRPYNKNGVLTRYCRCGQTAHYIREIKTLYENYVRLTQGGTLAARPFELQNDI